MTKSPKPILLISSACLLFAPLTSAEEVKSGAANDIASKATPESPEKLKGAMVEKYLILNTAAQREAFAKLVDDKKINGLTENQIRVYLDTVITPDASADRIKSAFLTVAEAGSATAPTTTFKIGLVREKLSKLSEEERESAIAILVVAKRVTGLTPEEQTTYRVLAKKQAGPESSAISTALREFLQSETTKPAEKQAPEVRPCFVQFIHTGASLLNPYHFTPPSAAGPARLDSGGNTEVAAFIEYAIVSRLAWSPGRIDDIEEREFPNYQKDGSNFTSLFSGLDSQFNFDARLNITLGSGGNDSTTANAIMGTGDFGCEISTGMPVLLFNSPDCTWTLGPELSHSIVTRKSDFEAINRSFFGVSYDLSCTSPVVADTRVLFRTRFGYALVDALQFRRRDIREIKTDFGDRPQYSLCDAMALEAELIHPITTGSAVTLAMKFYSGVQPNTWMASIGYTISIDSLIDGIFAKGSRGGSWKKPE